MSSNRRRRPPVEDRGVAIVASTTAVIPAAAGHPSAFTSPPAVEPRPLPSPRCGWRDGPGVPLPDLDKRPLSGHLHLGRRGALAIASLGGKKPRCRLPCSQPAFWLVTWVAADAWGTLRSPLRLERREPKLESNMF